MEKKIGKFKTRKTLRDQFAIAALQGMIADDSFAMSNARSGKKLGEFLAEQAYEMADWMMIERAKKW